jgi:flagellin
MLSLVTNEASLIASDALDTNQTQLNTTIEQLATGERIVNAAIDPAGLSIAMEMGGLLGSLNQDSTNVSNASGMLQTADGALQNIGNAITTIQQLASEAADGTVSNTQRASLDAQFQQLYSEINNIAQSSQFNGINLLDGSTTMFQVGPNDSTADQLTVNMPNVTSNGLWAFNIPSGGLVLSADNYYGTDGNYNGVGTGSVAVADGTGTTPSSVAANTVASTAVSGAINQNAPNWVMLTVKSIATTSGTAETSGAIGTDVVTFSLTTANGQNEGTITLNTTDTSVQNLGGSGADFTLSGNVAVGQQVAVTFGPNLLEQASAQSEIGSSATALQTVASYRGTIGAYEQQLNTISANLQSETQNLTSALSNIQDANVAQTFATFTKQMVLQQAGISVLKEADSIPQNLATLFP